MRPEMSPKQHRVFDAVIDLSKREGVDRAPTLGEIATVLDTSPTKLMQEVRALKRKGYVDSSYPSGRHPEGYRALMVWPVRAEEHEDLLG